MIARLRGHIVLPKFYPSLVSQSKLKSFQQVEGGG